MLITFHDGTEELSGVLQTGSRTLHLTINGVEFDCEIQSISTKCGNLMHLGLGTCLGQSRRKTLVECYAKNKTKAELSQAKDEVRKAQKAFKDAQRKLSELQKGSK